MVIAWNIASGASDVCPPNPKKKRPGNTLRCSTTSAYSATSLLLLACSLSSLPTTFRPPMLNLNRYACSCQGKRTKTPRLIEPVKDNGFRASGLGADEVVVEGRTDSEALLNLRKAIEARIRAGAKLTYLEVATDGASLEPAAGVFEPPWQKNLGQENSHCSLFFLMFLPEIFLPSVFFSPVSQEMPDGAGAWTSPSLQNYPLKRAPALTPNLASSPAVKRISLAMPHLRRQASLQTAAVVLQTRRGSEPLPGPCPPF